MNKASDRIVNPKVRRQVKRLEMHHHYGEFLYCSVPNKVTLYHFTNTTPMTRQQVEKAYEEVGEVGLRLVTENGLP